MLVMGSSGLQFSGILEIGWRWVVVRPAKLMNEGIESLQSVC